MYAHSDYRCPMHDGRVLDVGKERELYSGEEKKKKKETTHPNQTSKEQNKSYICLMHLRGDKWIVHKL